GDSTQVANTLKPRRDYLARSFFFQAEDGIRDFHVTGVQTCALPISRHSFGALRNGGREGADRPTTSYTRLRSTPPVGRSRQRLRSEERRVGKECRSRRGP